MEEEQVLQYKILQQGRTNFVKCFSFPMCICLSLGAEQPLFPGNSLISFLRHVKGSFFQRQVKRCVRKEKRVVLGSTEEAMDS